MTRAQRKAFMEMATSGQQLNYRHQVYKAILEHSRVTLDHIAYRLPHLRPSTIAGRVSELLNMGFITEELPIKNDAKGQSVFVAVWNIDVQELLASKRLQERYERWIKTGLQLGYFERYKDTALS